MMRYLRNVVLILCAGLLAAPAVALAEAAAQAGPTNDAAAEEKARKFFTDLEVVDQNGRKLRFYSDVLKGRVVLINFIFINCPDACPMVTHKLMQVRSMMVPTIKDNI